VVVHLSLGASMLSLRLAVVLAGLASAAACGGSYSQSPASPSPAPPAGAPSLSVTIPTGAEALGNRAFVPSDLTVDAGTTVTWTNSDRVSHTSTSDAAGWNSGTIPAGGQFAFRFQNSGTFRYHCTIHPGMIGTVVVR
jgi:plastocyanin